MSISNKNIDNLYPLMTGLSDSDLESRIKLPLGWTDMPREAERYEWLKSIGKRFGGASTLSQYRALAEGDFPRAKDGGVLSLTMGFFVDIINTPKKGFVSTTTPRKRTTMNLLPYMAKADEIGSNIPFSAVLDTPFKSSIAPTGVLIQPGECINIYSVESVSIPEQLRGIVVAKRSFAPDGLGVIPGVINKGWQGHIILEMYSLTLPFLIEMGVHIAQVALMDASMTVGTYAGEFQAQSPNSISSKP